MHDLRCYSQAKYSKVVDGGVDGLHAPAGPAREERARRSAVPAPAAATCLPRQGPTRDRDGSTKDSEAVAAR
jgi:hypothetical protein